MVNDSHQGLGIQRTRRYIDVPFSTNQYLSASRVRYLLEKALAKEPTPEELYLSGAITLKAYEETRFPGEAGWCNLLLLCCFVWLYFRCLLLPLLRLTLLRLTLSRKFLSPAGRGCSTDSTLTPGRHPALYPPPPRKVCQYGDTRHFILTAPATAHIGSNGTESFTLPPAILEILHDVQLRTQTERETSESCFRAA